MGYSGVRVYIMNFGWSFQYLFAWEGEVWQDRVTIRPNLLLSALYLLKLTQSPYTKVQLEQGEEIALSGAIRTIDRLNDPEYKEAVAKAKEKSIKDFNSNCMWQVRTFNEKTDEKCYYCLTHGEFSPMEEGKLPQHK